MRTLLVALGLLVSVPAMAQYPIKAPCNATAKGDICVYTGSQFLKLVVGSNTQVLTADSTRSMGLKWAAGGGGGGGSQTFAQTYALGASAADDTALIQSGFGGPIIFKANGAATGPLVQAQKSDATVLFNVTDNGTNVLDSAAALQLCGTLATSCALGRSGITTTITQATIPAPTLSGTVLGTYTLGGTPTITSPNISSPTLSGTAIGTYSLGGTPTITAATLSGSFTGTYTLAGTPTITSPAISSPTLSGTSAGTYTLGGTPTLSGATIAGTTTVSGATTFTAAGTGLTVNNNSTFTGTTLHTGVATFTAIPLDNGGGLTFADGGSSGTNVGVSGAATGIIRYNNTTPAFEISMQGGAFVALSTGGGGGSTLAASYNLGAGASDQTLTEASGKGNQPIFLKTAIATAQTVGLTLQNTTAAANNAQQFSPAIEFESRGWGTTGGASQTVKSIIQGRPRQGTVANSEMFFSVQDGGGSETDLFKIGSFSAVNGAYLAGRTVLTLMGSTFNYIDSNGLGLEMGVSSASYIDINPGTNANISFFTGNQNYVMGGTGTNANAFYSAVGANTLGRSANLWTASWSKVYYTAVNVPAANHGALTIDPTLGDTVVVTSDGGLLLALTISTGTYNGQVIKLILKEDAGGTGTWTTSIGNATIVGGTYTKTVSASAVDTITLVYDSNATKWREIARSLNES